MKRRCPGKAAGTAREGCFEVADAIPLGHQDQPTPNRPVGDLEQQDDCLARLPAQACSGLGFACGRLLGMGGRVSRQGHRRRHCWGPVRPRWLRFGSPSGGPTGLFQAEVVCHDMRKKISALNDVSEHTVEIRGIKAFGTGHYPPFLIDHPHAWHPGISLTTATPLFEGPHRRTPATLRPRGSRPYTWMTRG